jgi:Pilus formation protein N terminal region
MLPNARLFWIVAIAVALSACGGGGGGGTSSSGGSTPPVTLATPVVSPTALTFDGTGSALNQSFTVTEASYSGAFAATTGNGSIATVSPASSSGAFSVTPIGGGTTNITIADASGQTVSVSVSVTSSVVEPQRHQ